MELKQVEEKVAEFGNRLKRLAELEKEINGLAVLIKESSQQMSEASRDRADLVKVQDHLQKDLEQLSVTIKGQHKQAFVDLEKVYESINQKVEMFKTVVDKQIVIDNAISKGNTQIVELIERTESLLMTSNERINNSFFELQSSVEKLVGQLKETKEDLLKTIVRSNELLQQSLANQTSFQKRTITLIIVASLVVSTLFILTIILK